MKGQCKECGAAFESRDSRKQFCNHSCAAIFNNRGSRKHGTAAIPCTRCGKKTRVRDGRSGYCSRECRSLHDIERWLAGDLTGCWKYTHASYVRKYLEEKNDCSCEHCGFNQTRKDGSSILQVDHIDGNWRNNRPENVRLLCPNCHALTDTWGAKNMGNGRKWKREYSQY